MFTIPFHRDNILMSSISDASTLLASKRRNVCVSMIVCGLSALWSTELQHLRLHEYYYILKFKLKLTLSLHAGCVCVIKDSPWRVTPILLNQTGFLLYSFNGRNRFLFSHLFNQMSDSLKKENSIPFRPFGVPSHIWTKNSFESIKCN